MKFRIRKETNQLGEVRFIPEKKLLWFWLNFTSRHSYYNYIAFLTLEECQKYIDDYLRKDLENMMRTNITQEFIPYSHDR